MAGAPSAAESDGYAAGSISLCRVVTTLGSYGPVYPDGTPVDPATYDYRRQVLDAMHFPKLVDRLIQNLRRCAGFKMQYFGAIEAQKRLVDVAGKQMNAGTQSAGKALEMIKPFPFIPLNELTREVVKSYVDAQKSLMDVMVKAPTNGAPSARTGALRA